MRERHVWLLLCFAALTSHAYFDGEGHPHEGKVAEAGEICRAQLGHATGVGWMQCTVELLLAWQNTAKAAKDEAFFPVAPHTYEPLAVDRAAAAKPAYRDGGGQQHVDLLKNLLRNYTCDVEDGGTQPVRSMTWEYQPPDPCADVALEGGDAPPEPSFTYRGGFLPAGDDLPDMAASLTEAEAKAKCLGEPRCAGFTFTSTTRGKKEKAKAKYDVHFKSVAENINANGEWHTFRKKKAGADCRPGFRKPPPPKLRLRVDVLRESPPVYLVHDFATNHECEFMMNQTIPSMKPSVVSGGSTSRHRQSFSVNMYPDYEDESNVITRMVRRKFAFAREVADYEELIEGVGQEPLNSVYYKNWEDQYRPHCDGQCYGGAYRKGERIATSLTYCAVADKGGYTMFTRHGLKVVPKLRQMLFFGYKLPPQKETGPPRMDDGLTEHTGCPLREGKKWIATMWYREGMTAEKGWESFSRGL